jgi:hypothetical protein
MRKQYEKERNNLYWKFSSRKLRKKEKNKKNKILNVYRIIVRKIKSKDRRIKVRKKLIFTKIIQINGKKQKTSGGRRKIGKLI